jgi:SAM-dependent methyltransferase
MKNNIPSMENNNKIETLIKKWQGHEGVVVASANGFNVIDCKYCGFKHITPIPTEEELEQAYEQDYYIKEKPLYLEQYGKDLEWWNMIYTERYKILERYLPTDQRRLLDIGSGPGFFLLNGKNRGWQVKGVEPSKQAAEHSLSIGLDVENIFFRKKNASTFGFFDAINLGEVLEHIPNPAELLTLIREQLNENGLICIIVPNDFNPFQNALRDHLDIRPWWVAPPHHINYFDFDSLEKLLERNSFEVVHKESTFPIDMFLLMGDNYIGNDELGRNCHTKRMNFEKTMISSGLSNLLSKLYSTFASLGIGREIVIFARKVKES